jgi:nicotinamidase-related amidase
MKTLIVVDMQNDFITGVLGNDETRAIVPHVVEKIKNWDGKLYFTRDTHFDNYMDTLEGKNLPIPHCIEDTVGWHLIDEVKDYATHSNRILNKYTFGYEDWDRYNWQEDTEIELIGVCTDICVISNALALRMFYPNLKITVDASCCAGVTPESHKAALLTMKMCQINVINE